MSTPDPDLARAIALMVEALEILDRCGEAAAAAHLQYAHDVALHGPGRRGGGEDGIGAVLGARAEQFPKA